MTGCARRSTVGAFDGFASYRKTALRRGVSGCASAHGSSDIPVETTRSAATRGPMSWRVAGSQKLRWSVKRISSSVSSDGVRCP